MSYPEKYNPWAASEFAKGWFPKETPFNNGQWEDFQTTIKRLQEKRKKEEEEAKAKQSALDTQVGGSHYKGFKIQPFEFFIANKIPFHKADIIKRILRYDLPTGKGFEDLRKIKHEIDLIIQLEDFK